jgi:hypothetical protein
VIAFTAQGTHPFVLPIYNTSPDHSADTLEDDGVEKATNRSYHLGNHDDLNLYSIYIVLPIVDNQWAWKIRSWGIITNCQQYKRLLVDALGRILTWKIDGIRRYLGRSIINAMDTNLTMSCDLDEHFIPCEMLWLCSGIYSQLNNSAWTEQQLITAGIMVASVPTAIRGSDSGGVSSYYNHIHILVPTAGIECAEFFPPHSMLPLIIQATHSTIECASGLDCRCFHW